MHYIASEPQLLVSFEINSGVIKKVNLSLSDAFYLEGTHPALLDWLLQYAQKKEPTTVVPLYLEETRSFSNRVLKQLKQISFGSKASYQSLSESLGNPKGARAVGNACASNPFPLFIPCHRVLQKNGKLGGFSCGLEIKKRLLLFEKQAFLA